MFVFECAGCDKKLMTAEGTAGRRVQCRGCGTAMVVPDEAGYPVELAESDFEVIEDEQEPPKRPTNRRRREDDYDDDPPPRRRPRRKKPKPRREAESQYHGPWEFEKGVAGGGLVVGLLAMIGAGVWFYLGWEAGRIYFYPPVLFCLGLVAFVKGMLGEE